MSATMLSVISTYKELYKAAEDSSAVSYSDDIIYDTE